MTRYAQVENGVVIAVEEVEESPGGGWVECPAHVVVGWLWGGEQWRMQRYALLAGGVVQNVIESAVDPDMQGEAWVACPDHVGPGWVLDGETWDEPAPSVTPLTWRCTKRAFQARFPAVTVGGVPGVVTKYDLMAMFLTDPDYAASLIADAGVRLAIRLLVQTGLNRMDASPYVQLDLPPGQGGAADFTALLMSVVPEGVAFRLTSEERAAILTTPLTDAQRYYGS